MFVWGPSPTSAATATVSPGTPVDEVGVMSGAGPTTTLVAVAANRLLLVPGMEMIDQLNRDAVRSNTCIPACGGVAADRKRFVARFNNKYGPARDMSVCDIGAENRG